MDREVIKSRMEFRVRLEKDQLEYGKLLEDAEMSKDVVCPECNSEKELVMSPYWGAHRRYYTCHFVCPECDKRR